ncbi:MAG: RidA family protein [Erysipelotrichaceae bacterium]|jgi:2-iminobutanoate/2-iminopropanoate deaminase|nr:RidA family protein [Bacillota bacterium]NLP21848.1 RidA family protein [Erysipelotrichaceae bacterium]
MFTVKISSENAPKAIGPYSPALQIGDFIYVSGQLPVDPKTNELVEDEIRAQTKMSLSNLKAILNEVSLDTRHIVKTTVYMTDLSEFNAMNEEYAKFFNEPYPARSAVQVAALPKGAKVEIEAFVIDTLKYEKAANGCYECDGDCSGC